MLPRPIFGQPSYSQSHSTSAAASAFSAFSLTGAMLRAGLLSSAQAAAIDQAANAAGNSRLTAGLILQRGLIDSAGLARFCADTFGYPMQDLRAITPASCPADLIDQLNEINETNQTNSGALNNDLLRNLCLAPLAMNGKRLIVAISDPGNLQILDRIKFQTQLTITPVIADHYQLLTLIAQLARPVALHTFSPTSEHPFEAGPAAATPSSPRQPDSAHAAHALIAAPNAAPVVQFLQKILDDAVLQRASDLHFEPFEKFFRIRIRVDGVLFEVASPPLAIRDQLTSRIKVISNLDIAEKRVPQDGRMRLTDATGRTIDCRVSTLPTVFGEKIVIRLLESGRTELGLDLETLGLEPAQRAMLTAAIARPHGMILVTGPTGSGKSRTLYACLNLLNRPGINIASAEDPAEIHLPGINQISINDRTGLTFPVVLRAFLRQDPDVIMIGEIRDLETADMALKAAQTGHLVLSTLHTNDAAATLTRLTNMGIAVFNIASSVTLIVAQRLVRRLCNCKQPAPTNQIALQQAGFTGDTAQLHLFGPAGCPHCHGSGYLGRIALYQMLPVTPAIEQLILARCSTSEINTAARAQGMQSLREAGLRKVSDGVTSLAEVLFNTNP